MSVKFIMSVYLQPFIDNKESIEVEGNTVGDGIRAITKKYPALKNMLLDDHGNLLRFVGVYVNDQDAYPYEMTKPLKNGDTVYLLYELSGG